MTRKHTPTLLATGLAALLSAALITVVPGYAAQSGATTSPASAEQTAAKQLAEQLSEAYSRVSIVRNGDVVTLNNPDQSQDAGTSTRQRRRMAPRVSLPGQYQAPVTSVKDQGGSPHLLGVRSNISHRIERAAQNLRQRAAERQQRRQRHRSFYWPHLAERVLHAA